MWYTPSSDLSFQSPPSSSAFDASPYTTPTRTPSNGQNYGYQNNNYYTPRTPNNNNDYHTPARSTYHTPRTQPTTPTTTLRSPSTPTSIPIMAPPNRSARKVRTQKSSACVVSYLLLCLVVVLYSLQHFLLCRVLQLLCTAAKSICQTSNF